MTDYTDQIERIRKATSLDDIQAVARQYSAKAVGEGGILYSGYVGEVKSEVLAVELAEKTGLPIINNTPRAQFLADSAVSDAIKASAERIYKGQGESLAAAQQSATNFLYGDAKAVGRSATSLDGCLWGEASHEFAGSLRGNVTLVASAASPDRVFGKVEVPTVLHESHAGSLGSKSVADLRAVEAKGGIKAVLPEVQANFIQAAPHGIFVSPENVPGKAVTKVVVSKEAAAALGLDASKFSSAAELSASGLARAPLGLAAPTATLGLGGVRTVEPMPTRVAAEGEPLAASEAAARRGLGATAVKGAGVVAAAAVVYDVANTSSRANELFNQGNRVGGQSEIMHFGGRNLGMLGGAALGAEAGAALGIESGPGALLTGAAGGLIGAIGGEKLVDAIDNHRIYNQKDQAGESWHFDPKQPAQGWTRTITTNEIDPQGVPNFELGIPAYKTQTLTAPPALANELNYKASGVAVQMALAHAPKPQDPYSIPAGPGDASSLRESNWSRNPQTHEWARTVATGFIEHGMVISHTETATPQKAAQLTRESDAIVAQNIAHSPHAIAARYQTAYEQFGWNKFGVPTEAVTTALRAPDNKLHASDGHEYTRGQNGQWDTPGFFYGTNEAKGNVKDELNATFQREHAPAVAPPAKPVTPPTLEPPRPHDPRSPEHPGHAMYEKVREQVADLYAKQGQPLNREQLERTTAGVMFDAQKSQLKDVKELHLSVDPATRKPDPNGHIFAYAGDPRQVTTLKSSTDVHQAQQATPEQTYTRMGQLAQPQAQVNAPVQQAVQGR